MSWVTPRTWIAGELVTAALLNTHIRDNELELRATPANRCDAYHNTTQSVTSGNTNALNLNSETIDSAAMHDTVTNNSRVTIPTGGAGVYLVKGMTLVNHSGATAALHIRHNGSTNLRSAGTGASAETLVVEAMVVLAAADYVELTGQATTADITFGSATTSFASRLSVIGPLPPS